MKESGRQSAAAGKLPKEAARTLEALAKIGAKIIAHREAIAAWKPLRPASWLTDDVYMTKIHPALGLLSKATIATALGVAKDYVHEIVRGDKVPNRRHWLKLEESVGVTPG